MPLLLAIPDPPDMGHAAPGEIPALPALSELMRQGRASLPDRDWRSGLLRDVGLGHLASLAPAEIAAHALSLEPGSSVCLASPVHVVAGMSRVHLHAEGVLRLSAGQRSGFHAAFVAQFGHDPLLHPVGEGFVLEAPWAHVADDGDPCGWRGAPLSRSPAGTPELQSMRRTGAEIEMWLAASAWNEARERSGALTANLLWLWGGGRVPIRTAARLALPLHLHAGHVDPWLGGLAALVGQSVQSPPDAWNESGIDADAPGHTQVILLPAAGNDMRHWQDMESRWFEPLLRDLRARRQGSLTLRLGRRSWLVRPRMWRSLLRKSRPWWQVAGA